MSMPCSCPLRCADQSEEELESKGRTHKACAATLSRVSASVAIWIKRPVRFVVVVAQERGREKCVMDVMDSDPTCPLRRGDQSEEELESKERTRKDHAVATRASGCSVVFAGVLLLQVHRAGTAVASDGTRYWTGWGIFLLECAMLLVIGAGLARVAALTQTDSQVEAEFAARKAAATSVESTIKDLQLDNDSFGMYHLDTARRCKALMFGSRLLLNVFFVTSTFAKLPPRDPHERLNEAKYFVSVAEVVGLSIMSMVMAVRLCNTVILARRLGAADDPPSKSKNDEFGSACSDVAGSANLVATFSAVRLVRTANPARATAAAMGIVKDVKLSLGRGAAVSLVTEAFAAGSILLTWTLFAMLGMLALLVKVNQIGLFTEVKFSPELLLRDPVECLTFLGFAVAIGSTSTDMSKLEGILGAATSGEEEINQEKARERIKSLVCGALCRKHGLLKGMACVLTLSPEMYTEVVFTKKAL